jgi:molybdate transport system substrate-binding protein
MSFRRYSLLAILMAVGLALAVLAVRAVHLGGRKKGATSAKPHSSIKVSAAASLTEAFSQAKARFEANHPGARVYLNLAGTETLCTQIRLGDRPDVFASADREHMERMQAEGFVSPFRVFARNRMILVAPRRGPGKVRRLADLAQPGRRVLLCDPNVPAGKYALELLEQMEKAGMTPPGFRERVLGNVVSRELDVKQVVTKVALGEGDVGFVYASDLTPPMKESLRQIPLPEGAAARVTAEYTIAVTAKASNPTLAREFLEFVLSAEGQRIMAGFGFEPARPGEVPG